MRSARRRIRITDDRDRCLTTRRPPACDCSPGAVAFELSLSPGEHPREMARIAITPAGWHQCSAVSVRGLTGKLQIANLIVSRSDRDISPCQKNKHGDGQTAGIERPLEFTP